MKEGFYADWDIKEISRVLADEDVTVEYVRYLTTLAGSEIRDNGQSAVLVDGTFKTEDKLEDTKCDTEGIVIEDIEPDEMLERWKISFPEDGNEKHQIRYQAPQGQTDGIAIYVKSGSGWTPIETEMMGIYHLFTVEGNEVEMVSCQAESGIMDYLVYIVIGGLAVIVLVVAVGIRHRRKRKRTSIPEAEAV